MKRETWLFVQPERLNGKPVAVVGSPERQAQLHGHLAMPVHGHAERTAGMLLDLLACAGEDLGGTLMWWYGPRSRS